MAAKNITKQTRLYLPRDNNFYRNHYHHILYGLMTIIIFLIIAVSVVLYQVLHKPLPIFFATQTTGARMQLTSFSEPNLLADTILRWASKGATLSYNFDFLNYNRQLALARPYFTDAGWQDYLRSVNKLITTIVANQLFVNGVVSGTPVIANQGPLPGKGYVWRIQIPFLVTYQSANAPSQDRFVVVVTLVRVPTEVNPQGIGIDQFVMVSQR